MKLNELFTMFEWGDRESRADIDWHNDLSKEEPKYGIFDRYGKVIRPDLTQRAATLLSTRQDLRKKHGPLFVKKM